MAGNRNNVKDAQGLLKAAGDINASAGRFQAELSSLNTIVSNVTNVWEDTGELEVDGFLGVQSVTAWQVALGTVADGFVSSQPWRCYGNTPNLVSVERCYGADGSSLVRAVQRVVSADVDGLMGPQTVRCLQAWLNSHGFDCGAVDGVLGPATAKAIQRSLNAGAWS